ncbi:hypothetical protein N657DRAFT_321599 [Parathielavia appendiculata]|uniref:Uncharacterized protein n=1 Tax=Parathielavia appendiculata TaxID=2587402 RepID=A0AAN6TQZ7_9PEZI|nr:hypothetical protein N657DRAFT_321599 [Parathielavia appendiculata]
MPGRAMAFPLASHFHFSIFIFTARIPSLASHSSARADMVAQAQAHAQEIGDFPGAWFSRVVDRNLCASHMLWLPVLGRMRSKDDAGTAARRLYNADLLQNPVSRCFSRGTFCDCFARSINRAWNRQCQICGIPVVTNASRVRTKPLVPLKLALEAVLSLGRVGQQFQKRPVVVNAQIAGISREKSLPRGFQHEPWSRCHLVGFSWNTIALVIVHFPRNFLHREWPHFCQIEKRGRNTRL